jgi:hypothetical protein
MPQLTTRTHAVLDHLLSLLIVAAPWLFGFARGGAETWVPVAIGSVKFGLNLLTDYEGGLLPRVLMPVHLGLDVGLGVLLAVSPWALNFFPHAWAAHLSLGLVTIAAALNTHPFPVRSRLGASPSP